MNIYEFTSIGRPIDPAFRTNRAIVLISFGVFVAGTGYRLLAGFGPIPSVLWGAGTGLSVFLAWAICREIDPDHDGSAFAAAFLTIPGIVCLGIPAFLGLFWLLLAVRVINRSTGLAARVTDSLSVLGLGGWLLFREGWIWGLALVAVFLLDGLVRPALRGQLVFAGLSVGLLAAAAIAGQRQWYPVSVRGWSVAAAAGLAALFLPFMVSSRRIRSTGDATGEPLLPARVISAQALALALSILLAVAGRDPASSVPLWSALAGAALYLYFRFLSPPNPDHGNDSRS